ncbi:hypothetical protein H6P81_000898 [Aristolochia fimbriata]|uniref:Pectinesterase inhibitor domain-containing protein n=1 Tax=Aristolochia fimbriata TaxID=158543 RepID=A0AAV7F5C8_ARIFI|nr:hypothetical protein H6P81_000898 [Aristolochia fimbriata]
MGLSITNFLVTLIIIGVPLLYQLQTVRSEASTATATGGQIVQQICNRAAESISSFDYDFCLTSLQSKGASADIKRLGIIATSSARSKAKDAGKKVDKLLSKSPDDLYVKTRLRDCKEMYSEAMDALKEAERAINSKNYMDGNEYLNAALDSIVTCEDSWQEEPGHVSPLPSDQNQHLEQLCQIGLSITSSLIAPVHLDHDTPDAKPLIMKE